MISPRYTQTNGSRQNMTDSASCNYSKREIVEAGKLLYGDISDAQRIGGQYTYSPLPAMLLFRSSLRGASLSSGHSKTGRVTMPPCPPVLVKNRLVSA